MQMELETRLGDGDAGFRSEDGEQVRVALRERLELIKEYSIDEGRQDDCRTNTGKWHAQ